jgi:PPE-repeat protein
MLLGGFAIRISFAAHHRSVAGSVSWTLAAMAHGLELVTNNAMHFGRIAGLSVCGY